MEDIKSLTKLAYNVGDKVLFMFPAYTKPGYPRIKDRVEIDGKIIEIDEKLGRYSVRASGYSKDEAVFDLEERAIIHKIEEYSGCSDW